MRPQKDQTDMSSAIDKHLVMTSWIWVALGDCAYRASAVANALANGRPRQECYPVAKNLGATLRAQVSADLRKHKNSRAGWVPDERSSFALLFRIAVGTNYISSTPVLFG